MTEEFEIVLSDKAVLAARRIGNPAGTRLVITHGNGFAIDAYRVFWEPLAKDFDLVLFDMRNHGRSPFSGAGGHHYARLAIDIGEVAAEVQRRFGSRPTVGVFHSFSARSALKHAVEYGRVWDGMVLYDPPTVPPKAHPLYEAMRRFEIKLVDWSLNRQERFASVEELIEVYRTGRPQARWVEQARTDMARAILQRDAAQGDFVLTCARELEATIYLQALTLDLWPQRAAVEGPVLLVGADPEMAGTPPTAQSNRALGQENGFDYVSVAGGGHLLQIEQPDGCREVLLGFLDRLGLGPKV